MNELNWNECDDPRILLKHLPNNTDPRKLRLFAVGATQVVSACLTDETRYCLSIAEQFADGQATQTESKRARQRTFMATLNVNRLAARAQGPAKAAVCWSLADSSAEAASRAIDYVLFTLPTYLLNQMSTAGNSITGKIIRQVKQDSMLDLADLFRGIFRDSIGEPVPTPPRTATTISIAEKIYQEKEFLRMPILGDALEEAGCINDEILDHCRRPRYHARGCWVLDAILGNECAVDREGDRAR
ncbi:MAG: hypothetical protein ACFCD0_09235 [Gemmataceae bacterium]